MESDALPPALSPPGVVILAGPFGSGKTEIAINLALRWADCGPTYLADLDVVTPYFRSREASKALGEGGVRVLAPGGDAGVYDAPVLPPGMAAAVADRDGGLVVDIGGEPHGAGVLAHWQEALSARSAKMLLVTNPHRPGADRPERVVDLARAISAASGLAFSGILSNGNLGRATAADDVAAGITHSRAVGRVLGLPVCAACLAQPAFGACSRAAAGLPVLLLRRFMRPAWET